MDISHSSSTFARVQRLAEAGQVKISAHGYDELAVDGLYAQSLIEGIGTAVLLEDYPLFPKGPCVLVFQKDESGRPVHAVWGIPRGSQGPAVLITAYRPEDSRWDEGFTRRRS